MRTDQEAGAGRVAWMANMAQTGEEHAVGKETLTDLGEVACLADEQGVQVEPEGEVVGASTVVPAGVEVAGSARSLGVVEGEGEHFGCVHARPPRRASQ